MRNRKYQSKRNSYKLDYVKSNLLLYNKLPVRPFSSTTRRKVDPLSITSMAFATPYSYSLLANPLAGAFILLMGLATTLFFLTSHLPEFFGQDPSYVVILQRLENIFLLYEKFLSYEQSGIDMLLANIDNFSPEILHGYYLSLQELLTVRESLFVSLSSIINSPEMEFLDQPMVNTANRIFEELRSGGNNLVSLIRNIESKLNIPQNERIPSFWFEE